MGNPLGIPLGSCGGPRDAAPSQRNPYSALWFSREAGSTSCALRRAMISTSARFREDRTGVWESPPPSSYGDVGSFSPPVDWNMPNAVSKVVRPSTSTCEMLHEIRVSIDRFKNQCCLKKLFNASSLLMKWMRKGQQKGSGARGITQTQCQGGNQNFLRRQPRDRDYLR